MEEGKYYFPKDIGYFCKAYSELKIWMNEFIRNGDKDIGTAQLFHKALVDYHSEVPLNVRRELTGLLL